MHQGSILQGIWAGFKYVHGHPEIRVILGKLVESIMEAKGTRGKTRTPELAAVSE